VPAVKADQVLARVLLSDGKEMTLSRWDRHLAIEVGGRPLMSSHDHGSEDELGRVVGELLVGRPAPKVLIGGLGLGYTLRAALDVLPARAKVTVAELVPEVVAWNRGVCARLAKRPLDDRRVKVIVGDVARQLRARAGYDAILLDVDNGPDAVTYVGNAKLYQRAGLIRAHAALRAGGVLAVWSAFPSRTFTTWLEGVGFEVAVRRATPTFKGGPRYYIWVARKRDRRRRG
jgi:spermidine synthase